MNTGKGDMIEQKNNKRRAQTTPRTYKTIVSLSLNRSDIVLPFSRYLDAVQPHVLFRMRMRDYTGLYGRNARARECEKVGVSRGADCSNGKIVSLYLSSCLAQNRK